MNWTKLLKSEIEDTVALTLKLIDKVDPDSLNWKPSTGDNWMTVGQLLRHLGESCGVPCRGFVTGDWGLPEGMKFEDIKVDEMLPPAEKMPSVSSIEEAKKLVEADKALALEMVDKAGEDDLDTRMVAAPWAPGQEAPLGRHLLQMVGHLGQHKGQLFYYLKLQGTPVNTMDLM